MTEDKPADTQPLPQAGGSYTRQEDGALKRAEETAEAAKRPAGRNAKKEA